MVARITLGLVILASVALAANINVPVDCNPTGTPPEYTFDSDPTPNPTLEYVKGDVVTFQLDPTNCMAMPFHIRETLGGTDYPGVVNNGANTGDVILTVPTTGFSVLFYQDGNDATANGQIDIVDAVVSSSSSTGVEEFSSSSSTAVEEFSSSSSTAVEAVSSSSTAVEAVSSSSTAVEAVSSSSTAVEESSTAASSTAVEQSSTAVEESSTAVELSSTAVNGTTGSDAAGTSASALVVAAAVALAALFA